MSHVIVFGNEKGGSGKSTTAVHVAVALMKQGFSVAALDLDSRQRSFARYIENREQWTARNDLRLGSPMVQVVGRSGQDRVTDAKRDEEDRFGEALLKARVADFVVIDSPGSDTHLARLGHAAADTLVTPLNDSFVDFDLLAKVDPDTLKILSPSLYSELVWESRKRRAMADRGTIDWVVMRNRVSNLDARNKRRVWAVLEDLSRRIGFRVGPGLSERVVYRELFPYGLTLLDLGGTDAGVKLTMSHVAARQEVRDLVVSLDLPGLENLSAQLQPERALEMEAEQPT